MAAPPERADDAGGGRRGLRAVPSDGLLALLERRYAMPAPAGTVDLGGSSNLNLLVHHAGRPYVVRVYRPYVSTARLADIQLARRRLAEGGIPCPQPVPTVDGEPWTVLDGRPVEVEEYVDRDATMSTWGRIEAGLPVLGRIHEVLEPLLVGPESRAPSFVNHVPAEQAVEATARGVARIRSWEGSSPPGSLADSAEALARLVDEAERELTRTLPRQLVHGDFWDDNVYFREGRLVLVNDLDHMGERPRIDDLALTLYFTHLQDPVGDAPERRMSRLASLVDVYETGLGSPLTGAERMALPLALARQPLWSIGGWVASLDDERTARAHAAGMPAAVDFALSLVRDLPRWQAAFA